MSEIVIVQFFGTLWNKGNYISQLLLERRIIHDFILSEDLILSLHSLRDLNGYDRICRYLEKYEYLIDISRRKDV